MAANNKTDNVLLLGESGVGKSTLINSIANYLTYTTLDEAKQSKLITLIGTSFLHITDNSDGDCDELNIVSCDDENECKNIGQSATQYCRSYKFNIGYNKSVRIIDTPGISDTRGTERDIININNIMKVIELYGQITAFCVVLKSDHTRINDAFKNFLVKLFSQLHQNIKENIVFIITYGKTVDYSANNAIFLMNEFFAESKIGIKINRDNGFCFENDTFNHLVTLQHKLESTIMNCDNSWTKSWLECRKLINYLILLKPHNVNDTLNVNKTRHLLDKLTHTLSEIVAVIDYNINTANEHKSQVEANSDLVQLKKFIFTEELIFETIKCLKPKLVCTSNTCTTFHNTGVKFVKAVYSQTCCANCGPYKHLFNHGSHVKFTRRALFSARYCEKCDCVESDHRIVYFEIRVTNKAEDKEFMEMVSKTTHEIELKKKLLSLLEQKLNEYRTERQLMIKALVVFYYYLKQNSIVNCGDIFAQQMRQNIDLFQTHNQSITGFQEILDLYFAEKKEFKAKQFAKHCLVTERELETTKQSLCQMKMNGENVRQIYYLYECDFIANKSMQNDKCIDVSFF